MCLTANSSFRLPINTGFLCCLTFILEMSGLKNGVSYRKHLMFEQSVEFQRARVVILVSRARVM